MRLPPPIDWEKRLRSALQGAQAPPVDDWRRSCDLSVLNRWERTQWLRHAMRHNDDEAFDYLLSHGFAKYAKSGASCMLWSALMRPSYIRKLVAHGCDPNCTEKTGRPILHRALADGYPEIIEVLLDCGADPNRMYKNYHPLDWADSYSLPLLEAAGALRPKDVSVLQ
jgi:Ankyrin repeats (3 copies)